MVYNPWKYCDIEMYDLLLQKKAQQIQKKQGFCELHS